MPYQLPGLPAYCRRLYRGLPARRRPRREATAGRANRLGKEPDHRGRPGTPGQGTVVVTPRVEIIYGFLDKMGHDVAGM